MIFLTAGHHNKDSGAISNGYFEAKETIRVRNRVSELFRAKCVEVWNEDDNWTLQKVINEITKLSKPTDIICDIHFNAGSATATGSECFVPDDAIKSELLLAADLCKVSEIIGIRNRGVKREKDSQHKRLGMMRPSGINVLLEFGFISNNSDMKLYKEHFESACQYFCETLFKHSR
jgi:N-acetylmuramoyl-L-alanine amidase